MLSEPGICIYICTLGFKFQDALKGRRRIVDTTTEYVTVPRDTEWAEHLAEVSWDNQGIMVNLKQITHA